MNDLEQNLIRKLVNQNQILIQQLIYANHDLAAFHIQLGDALSLSDTIEWKRTGAKIEGRIAALESLKPKPTY